MKWIVLPYSKSYLEKTKTVNLGEKQQNKKNKMCLWNTMPPIMANSNEGQDHKEKYFDTSRKIVTRNGYVQ